MSKKKDYDSFMSNWFYEHFIKNTINDNFYTNEEIIKNQKDIIERVKNFDIKSNKKC